MAEKMIDVVIERDIWVREGDEVIRHRKGKIVTVPLDEQVLDGIAAGAVRRATPDELKKAAEAKSAKG